MLNEIIFYGVFLLLSDSPASEFYVPTFRYIKFRRRGITQKKYTTFTTRLQFEIKKFFVVFKDLYFLLPYLNPWNAFTLRSY